MLFRILLTVAICMGLSCKNPNPRIDFSFRDVNRPVGERVDILLRQMTLEEKVSQMLDFSPPLDRFGIPSYTWWNEGLHGVARSAFSTTVFPQAIGLAATWDTSLLKRVGDVIATEARAVYNLSRNYSLGERYRGLTFWSPNINIFRDPRWGRGQETYGEDPHLTSWMGYAFIRGLQGEDTSRPKVTACAKHFAVHSGPEATRHQDNYVASPKDLWETYLPAFRTAVQDAGVIGVMCAYNRMNNQPCCANDLLLNEILRKQWSFKGYLTSDCFALNDFYQTHKSHTNAKAAAIDALVHSVDLECGNMVYLNLISAVNNGSISEEQLDRALHRLFTIRFNLGTFDLPGKGQYDAIGLDTLECVTHKQLALEVARNSIVMLKNDGTLPIKKSLRRIAVLGPNADNSVSILGNYNGFPSRTTTLLQGIREKLGNTEIIFDPVNQYTESKKFQPLEGSSLFSYKGKPGINLEYILGNPSLGKSRVNGGLVDRISIHRATGELPQPNVPADDYIARYSSSLKAPASKIVLEVQARHGYRLFLDGKKLIDRWDGDQRGRREYVELNLKEGKSYSIVMECLQRRGHFSASMQPGVWVKPDMKGLISKVSSADVIIYAGGISPELEGEEMEVNYSGFANGDRTSIQLPGVQSQILSMLKSTGKPVVFVMMTGSAIAVTEEDKSLNAIVNGWYGGQYAGQAVADVLFGDYNPSGRLPVTFYASDKDLPAFNDYSMKNRTYRYFSGKPLYPFGYGLSYSTFVYDGLTASYSGNDLKIKVSVKNSGSMDGDEVAQFYISYPDEPDAPIKSLKAFRKLHLKKGTAENLTFVLGARELQLIAKDGKAYLPKSRLVVAVGGVMPGTERQATSNWVELEVQTRH